MNLIPKNGRLIVQRDEAKTKTKSGLFIPGDGQKKNTGVVLASAEPKEDEAGYATGQRVLFGKYAGTEFEWEGSTYLLLEQHEIIAVVPES